MARSSQSYSSINGAIGGVCNAALAARTTDPGWGFPTGGSGGNFGTPPHHCGGPAGFGRAGLSVRALPPWRLSPTYFTPSSP